MAVLRLGIKSVSAQEHHREIDMLEELKTQLLPVAIMVLALGGCATAPGELSTASAAAGAATDSTAEVLRAVDSWVANDLNSSLVAELSQQPRFQGRSVRVAVRRSGKRITAMNQLEHYSQRQIESALLQQQNIRLLSDITSLQGCGQQQLADIEIDLSIEPSAEQAVWRVRLLETGSESWVGGYDFSQRVALDAQSKQMLQSPHAASVRAGSRDAPFEVQQSDLVSLALADSLICTLGPVATSVPVFLHPVATGPASSALAAQLASALKRADSLRIVSNVDDAHLQLNLFRRELGDGTLNITATPLKLRNDPDMPTTASVYQKSPAPVTRGQNWTSLNTLARQPALRQVAMNMPTSVRVGETHSISFTAKQAGRFWVLQVSPSDRLEMIFPVTQQHVDQGENLIAAGETRSYSFVMEPPAGDYLMTVLLTDKSASLKDVLGDTALASAPDVADFAVKGVRLLEPRDWGMMLHQLRIE